MKHNVLLLGSGMMSQQLIAQLISYGDTKVTVASNIIKDAEAICKMNPKVLTPAFLDVSDIPSLEKLIAAHDHVISFIPPWMHTPICEACIRIGRNMSTSSYVSPDMIKMDPAVKAKGLIFLNECGLDPGIDIMGTMKILHEANAAGYKIYSYESYCGGLPVAEQADNPLGYKFSWNPGAAIKASRNRATFKQNGQIVVTDTPLKCSVVKDDFSVSMKIESFPNRDSTVFMEKFGMSNCETFIRGTLRFVGFSDIISSFHDIGLTSDEPADKDVKTLRDLLESKIAGVHKHNSSLGPRAVAFLEKVTQGLPAADASLVKRALARADFAYINDDKLLETAIKNIVKTMQFLGFFDDNQKVQVLDKAGKQRPCLDVLGDVMGVKLALTEHDRDLVVMRHVFGIEDPKDKSRWEHTSTMVASGNSAAQGGPSIMSKTVGVTCALGTRLILEKKISQRGVLSPMAKEIYQPILADLEKNHGVTMIEESENPQAWAKMCPGKNRAKM